MENVALTTSQLNQLVNNDPCLKPFYYDTLACDEMPKRPSKNKPQAYIVNTDRKGQPGQHWIALWTHHNVCEIMDSYALPLDHYEALPLKHWVETHWKYSVTNGRSLQAVPTQSCGHYCFIYLQEKARGRSLQDFLNMFSKHDYIANDHKVGMMLKQAIEKITVTRSREDQGCQ